MAFVLAAVSIKTKQDREAAKRLKESG